jgi:Icc-related predicted phosphoesterase
MDWAFNLPRGPELARRWAWIPEDTDILITHGPPLGFGDRVDSGERVGCEDLLRRVRQLRPKLHLFGHIHEDGGLWTEGATTFANVTSDYCRRAPQVLRFPPA